uniref:Multidrug and toxin extrusion protein n=1 Tax=Neovison vison TaxID=452646 RepID=A0A8C7BCB1_NEOVI
MDRVQDTAPQDQGGCCPALRRLVPIGFGAEVWTLFVLSGPLFLFQVLTFMIHVVSSVFCGHLGKLELASVTLSVAFVNVCGVSIGLGLSSACDTLMSQSFGSPNKKHVGVILQRGTLVLLLCCFPCWGLFLNTQQILLLFRQDPAVSRLTQEYVLIFIPALPVSASGWRGIVWPQVFSGIVGNCINGLANYILVSMLRLGVRGSAFASTLSFFVQTIFLFLYIVLKKLHLETWAGWSSQCLQDWGRFFSLAVPSMLMVCIEWWAYEIGSFLMGLISVLDLSGQAILYELATVVYMVSLLGIPLGLSNAVCVRVGMALGAADTAQAKRSAISGMLCTVGTSLAVALLLSLLKNKLGHIFTNDEAAGVLRGTGKQAFGAIVNAIMYYVLGLPLGIVLTFVVRMRIMGLWLGMLACGLLGAVAFAVYTARMDWKLAAEEVSEGQSDPRARSSPRRSHPGPWQFVSAVAMGNSPGITLVMYSRPEGHVDLFGTPEVARAPSAPASPLSMKQLLVRRGATLGAVSAMLMVGLVIRFVTTRH